MTLARHYHALQDALAKAHRLAFLVDRASLNARMRRIPPEDAADAIRSHRADIIKQLTKVQHHSAEIEIREAILASQHERRMSALLISLGNCPAPEPAKDRHYRHAKAARQAVSHDFCGRCQATGIDPLSRDGEQLNCQHCRGTGLAESAA